MRRPFFILFASLTVLSACSGDDPTTVETETEKDAQITAPANQTQYTVGDKVEVFIEVNHPDLIADLELWVDDSLYAGNLELRDQEFSINSSESRVGHIPIYLKYTDGAGKEHRDNRTIVLFSDIEPENLEAQIVQTYPHNPQSYTQGLEFYNGRLFEGTGQKEQSKLLEVDLKTGTHLRAVSMDPAVFGEGITVLNDTIYQISYQSGRCFVYDLNSFSKLTEFSYAGEGWGLCNNGKSIIMSNGSDKIVWRDPKSFQVTKTIEIFDNKTNVAQINELELIDGDLYANLYMDSRIARIDTSTGKVLSYISFAAIVNTQPPGVDVLNGIARNDVDGKIFITGKWWPNLYQVIFE